MLELGCTYFRFKLELTTLKYLNFSKQILLLVKEAAISVSLAATVADDAADHLISLSHSVVCSPSKVHVTGFQ